MYCVYTILAFRRDSDGWQPKKKTSKSNTLHGPRKPESDLLGTFNKINRKGKGNTTLIDDTQQQHSKNETSRIVQ